MRMRYDSAVGVSSAALNREQCSRGAGLDMDEERYSRNRPPAFDSQGKARSTSRETVEDDSFSALDPSRIRDDAAVAEGESEAHPASADSSSYACSMCDAPFDDTESPYDHVARHLTDEKQNPEWTATLEAMLACYGERFERTGQIGIPRTTHPIGFPPCQRRDGPASSMCPVGLPLTRPRMSHPPNHQSSSEWYFRKPASQLELITERAQSSFQHSGSSTVMQRPGLSAGFCRPRSQPPIHRLGSPSATHRLVSPLVFHRSSPESPINQQGSQSPSRCPGSSSVFDIPDTPATFDHLCSQIPISQSALSATTPLHPTGSSSVFDHSGSQSQNYRSASPSTFHQLGTIPSSHQTWIQPPFLEPGSQWSSHELDFQRASYQPESQIYLNQRGPQRTLHQQWSPLDVNRSRAQPSYECLGSSSAAHKPDSASGIGQCYTQVPLNQPGSPSVSQRLVRPSAFDGVRAHSPVNHSAYPSQLHSSGSLSAFHTLHSASPAAPLPHLPGSSSAFCRSGSQSPHDRMTSSSGFHRFETTPSYEGPLSQSPLNQQGSQSPVHQMGSPSAYLPPGLESSLPQVPHSGFKLSCQQPAFHQQGLRSAFHWPHSQSASHPEAYESRLELGLRKEATHAANGCTEGISAKFPSEKSNGFVPVTASCTTYIQKRKIFSLDHGSTPDGAAVAEDEGKVDQASTDPSWHVCWKCEAPFYGIDSFCEHVTMHLTDAKEIEECTASLEAMVVCYGDEFECTDMSANASMVTQLPATSIGSGHVPVCSTRITGVHKTCADSRESMTAELSATKVTSVRITAATPCTISNSNIYRAHSKRMAFQLPWQSITGGHIQADSENLPDMQEADVTTHEGTPFQLEAMSGKCGNRAASQSVVSIHETHTAPKSNPAFRFAPESRAPVHNSVASANTTGTQEAHMAPNSNSALQFSSARNLGGHVPETSASTDPIQETHTALASSKALELLRVSSAGGRIPVAGASIAGIQETHADPHSSTTLGFSWRNSSRDHIPAASVSSLQQEQTASNSSTAIRFPCLSSTSAHDPVARPSITGVQKTPYFTGERSWIRDGAAVAEGESEAHQASADSSSYACSMCDAPFDDTESPCEHVARHLTDAKQNPEWTATLEAMLARYGERFERTGNGHAQTRPIGRFLQTPLPATDPPAGITFSHPPARQPIGLPQGAARVAINQQGSHSPSRCPGSSSASHIPETPATFERLCSQIPISQSAPNATTLLHPTGSPSVFRHSGSQSQNYCSASPSSFHQLGTVPSSHQPWIQPAFSQRGSEWASHELDTQWASYQPESTISLNQPGSQRVLHQQCSPLDISRSGAQSSFGRQGSSSAAREPSSASRIGQPYAQVALNRPGPPSVSQRLARPSAFHRVRPHSPVNQSASPSQLHCSDSPPAFHTLHSAPPATTLPHLAGTPSAFCRSGSQSPHDRTTSSSGFQQFETTPWFERPLSQSPLNQLGSQSPVHEMGSPSAYLRPGLESSLPEVPHSGLSSFRANSRQSSNSLRSAFHWPHSQSASHPAAYESRLKLDLQKACTHAATGCSDVISDKFHSDKSNGFVPSPLHAPQTSVKEKCFRLTTGGMLLELRNGNSRIPTTPRMSRALL
ncbi:hypothetical protein HPB50_000984 [Hyalomma asiaticum]|uniref:Uncharacterized protein n=1 Tax=Hyalomma asiaticum TaxID=266040 RepID=A0ACB7T0X4_HYAAI|nr:hypothetical protein HPB50_000984 [Hyalomma asiaticum]